MAAACIKPALFLAAARGAWAQGQSGVCEAGSTDCVEESSLLQLKNSADVKADDANVDASSGKVDDAANANADAKQLAGWGLTPYEPFKNPPEARSPMTLTVDTVQLCTPRVSKNWWGVETTTDVCWYTRAYGTDTIEPAIPGPTIRVKPGETLEILLKNKLQNPSPGASPFSFSNFYDLNSTNLHTHGLHISGETGNDDVWAHVPPGKSKQYKLDVVDYHMAGTHWYHPHSHHSTAVQAGGGLHGMLIVDDPPGSIPDEIANMEEKVMVLSLVDASKVSHTNGVFGQPLLEEMGGGHLWRNKQGHYVNFEDVGLLVNGQYKPKMTIKSGKWYRFRMVYATVEMVLRAFPFFEEDATCEMDLLAKDGIYLHHAPRRVNFLYFASGNRVDVAFRCTCTGKACRARLVSAATRPTEKLTKTREQVDEQIKEFEKKGEFEDGMGDPKSGALSGVTQKVLELELVHFDIEGEEEPEKPLQVFKVHRPCYLADLRYVAVPKRFQGRVELMNPIDFRIQYATQIVGGTARGKAMTHMDEPPLGELQVGEVYQWYVRGPPGRRNDKAGISIHPFHSHVFPYQIASIDSKDPFFMPGDWHDTLVHGSGQAMVKLQTNVFTGHMIVHCHILDHEDMGMMSYFQVKGKEGTTWRGAELVEPTCYRDPSGVGYTMIHASALLQTQAKPTWVQSEPGSNCHAACADVGGCLAEPASGPELELAMQHMNVTCDSVVDSEEEHAPSMLQGGACTRGFFEDGHCGIIAPEGVTRFCRCHGLETA